MLTLTIIVWIIGGFSALYSFAAWKIEETNDINNSPLFWLMIISLFIGGGIQYDVYGEVKPGIPLWFVSGLVFLGLNALSIIFFMMLHNARYGAEFSGKSVVSVIVSLVGFVSSVLGIISFYLDYLR